MPFAQPELIFLIVLIPLAIIIYLYYLKLRKRDIQSLGDSKLLKSMMLNTQIKMRNLKFAFLMLGLFFLIFSLLRPKWGKEKVSVKKHSAEICFILDNSLSMLAEDVYESSISFTGTGISRFEMAKMVLAELLNKYDGNQMSFMLISGKAQIECPMTFNRELIQNVYLNNSKIAPERSQGSYFANAFENVHLLFSEGQGLAKMVIFISDGENHEEGLNQAINKLIDKNIIVHTIGVGSKQGSVIPLNSIEFGSLPFKVDSNDRQVITRLDESTLSSIANETGGKYYHAQTNQKIGLLEKDTNLNGSKGKANLMVKKEQYQIFLFLSLGFFAIGFLLPESKDKIKSLFSAKQIMLFGIIFFTTTAFNQDEGDRHFKNEKYYQAIEEYTKAIKENPDPKLYMKRGNSHYKNKQPESAIKDYTKGLELSDNDKEKSLFHFNLGNSAFRQKKLNKAIEHYKESLRLDPDNEDARHNLFLLKKMQIKQNRNRKQMQGNNDQKGNRGKGKPQMDPNAKENQKNKKLMPDQTNPYKPDFNKKESIEDMEMKDDLNEIYRRDQELRSNLEPPKKGRKSGSNFFYHKDW